jgi:hypothetical protein
MQEIKSLGGEGSSNCDVSVREKVSFSWRTRETLTSGSEWEWRRRLWEIARCEVVIFFSGEVVGIV